ncbi:HAD family hydrolase [Irregularibacter muris]|uniref:HAD family hydrolase n=1 Tax=Irregularibacter muris TaxID=1796619 RepID=A0AAE3HEB1_9FIRM|nr:HAD family hydrolase [Irregularibacter muris]MCR1897877.1 HAD family hydrolase [Irregularibacter muris]
MINTFLFDLDGTLLPLDMDHFIKIYFGEMAKKLSQHIPSDKIANYIWQATNHMVKNTDPKMTNMEVFAHHFTQSTGKNFEELSPIFEEFYLNEFMKTKIACTSHPLVKEIIELLKEKGYTLVLATNPLFPKRAVLHRLEWAGLKEEDFTLITSYETMHACKPNIEYYQEILEKTHKTSQECMMIGNDVEEDLVAEKLGITTFLLEDQLIHRGPKEPVFDYKGSYGDLKDLIEKEF